jgi:hypothetical protein
MSRPARIATGWLDFVHAQSYGKSIGKVAPGFRPPPVPGLAGDELPIPWGDRAPLPALLSHALGTLRHEGGAAHRAYPSPRSLFPVHAYLLQGRDAWRFDPLRHALQPVAGSGTPAWDEPVVLALAGGYAGIPPAYGPLRFALAVLEAGHALRAVVDCAEALGLRAFVRLDFADEAVLGRLGLPRDGSWGPLALVELDRPPPTAPARDPVAEIERACWGEAPPAGGWERLRGLLAARTSGPAGGLSASAARIPVELVRRAAAAAAPPPGTIRPRLLAVAERVDGLDDGIHEAKDGELVLLRAGRHLGGVQRAYSYPAETANIRSMNLAWMLVVDHRDVLERHGARGLRLAQLAMGFCAQGIACALAAGGLFARPIRSYHEAVLDELLGLGPRESVGYQLLCGVPRWRAPALDLRPWLRPCEVPT